MSDRTSRVGFSCIGALLLAALLPTTARAESPALRLAALPEVAAEGRQLFVLQESITFECSEPTRYELSCDSRGELTVDNPSGQPIVLTLEVDRRASRVELDGASLPLTSPEGRDVQIATAEVPAGTSRLVVEIPGAYRLDGRPSGDIFVPALVTRHPLLGDTMGDPFSAEITLQSVKKYRRWGRVDDTRVALRYPEGWRWEPSAESAGAPPACPASGTPPDGLEGCLRTLPDGDLEAVWTFASPDRSFFARSVALTRPGGVVFNGGPVIGTGFAIGSGCRFCRESFRAWVGYEIGVTAHAVIALLAEYSPTERVAVVPVVELALLPQMSAIPAVTAGLGAPVRVWPKVDPGIRLQATVAWSLWSTFSLGVVLFSDLFPFVEQDWYPLFGAGIQLGV